MAWKVIDKLQNNKVIESHGRWEDAYRALMIFTAHEVLNGRKAHYAVDPEMVQAATPTLDELRLPSWAIDALMNATDDAKLKEIREMLAAEVKLSDLIVDEVIAEEVFMKKYARKGETLEDAKKRIAAEAAKKEPSDGARRAALRNPNYESMSAREQWEEDKALGILDWDGD